MVDHTIYALEHSACTRLPHPMMGAFIEGATNDR